METKEKSQYEAIINAEYIRRQAVDSMEIDISKEECAKALELLFEGGELTAAVENVIRKVLVTERCMYDPDDDLIIFKDYIKSIAKDTLGRELTRGEYDDIYETINERIPFIVADGIKDGIDPR